MLARPVRSQTSRGRAPAVRSATAHRGRLTTYLRAMGLGARVYGKRRRARLSAGGPGTGRGRTLMAPRTDIRALPAIADARRSRAAGGRAPIRCAYHRATNQSARSNAGGRHPAARGLEVSALPEWASIVRLIATCCAGRSAARAPARRDRPLDLLTSVRHRSGDAARLHRPRLDSRSWSWPRTTAARRREGGKRLARHATLGDSPFLIPHPDAAVPTAAGVGLLGVVRSTAKGRARSCTIAPRREPVRGGCRSARHARGHHYTALFSNAQIRRARLGGAVPGRRPRRAPVDRDHHRAGALKATASCAAARRSARVLPVAPVGGVVIAGEKRPSSARRRAAPHGHRAQARSAGLGGYLHCAHGLAAIRESQGFRRAGSRSSHRAGAAACAIFATPGRRGSSGTRRPAPASRAIANAACDGSIRTFGGR